MSIKTFWTIFVKILGVWLVLESVTLLPQLFSNIFYYNIYDQEVNYVWVAVAIILLVIFYLLILRIFIFRNDWFIKVLKLEKDFEEERIDVNIKQSTLIRISIIVIGGLVFIDGLPIFCKQVFEFLQEEYVFRESPSAAWVIFYFIKTAMGYLLMTQSNLLVTFIEKHSSTTANQQD